MSSTRRFAYLHGFGSGPGSLKGTALVRSFEARGLTFECPHLDRPSFARLSHAAMLEAVDALDARARDEGASWCFVGSSLGGWLAARWAELHPDRVERLVLLCPGFDLASRWPELVGSEGMARWERDGELPMENARGELVPVHWEFLAEARRQPAWPRVPCPTRIIHGLQDQIVPIESSRRYAEEHPHVSLLEVDDDHALASSVNLIVDEALAFFDGPVDRSMRTR